MTTQQPSLIAWRKTPNIVVVTNQANDPRVALVREAAEFWNQQLAAVGSSFRLRDVRETPGTIPGSQLVALSRTTVDQGGQSQIGELVKEYGDEIVIFLARGSFVSFTAGAVGGQTMIAIRGGNTFPCTLPNVCRNIIAHEMAHAIGLRHNSDPALLMCGRPAPCTPDLFASSTPKYFPLSEAEKTRLIGLYPREWKSH